MRGPSLLVLFSLLGAAQLAAQAGPTLGSGNFNGLKARVTGLRLYESGGGSVAIKDRVATTTFDALTTRFINLELELEYAKAAKRTPFQVECRFEGSGSARTLLLSGTIEAGWTGSYHAGGVGSAERGEWAEGTYKVSCREGGQVVASAQVEVVKSAAAVRKLGAAVIQMKFFQSLAERMPVETRRYSTRFDSRSNWIKTEFALVYPQATAPVTFLVECAYVFPDKNVKRVTVERQIPTGWTGSVHAQGIAADSSGKWPVGRYTVSCWNNGEKMAEAGFEVIGGRSQVVGGGELRFHTGKVEGTVAKTFEIGTYDTLFVDARLPLRAAGDSASFSCLLTDPAGLTSGFKLSGTVRERELVASGPVGMLEAPKLRGGYRVECRTGPRGVLADGFEVSGKPELAELDARLVNKALFAGGEEPPGDEAVPDVVFSAGKLKSLWVVALLDHPTAAAGKLDYSCRITGPRNVVVANSGAQSLPVAATDRAIVLVQRLEPGARQRWTPGKHLVQCGSGGTSFLRESVELTR